MALDPYRTLGLTPAASLDQVKRAYRRLAKQYHPDAAGDDATVRFLAVQAAYEAIVGGTTSSGRPGAASNPARPWQADAARARATRDAYRTRSSAWRSAGGSTARGPGGSGAGTSNAGAGPTGTGARSSSTGTGTSAAGAGAPGSEDAAATGRRARRGRPPDDGATGGASGEGSRASGASTSGRSGRRPAPRKKVTLTSTTYDEATREPLEREWDGGDWYGTTSGTYWTINPKEYADPRKHGPEYQARARRATAGRTGPPVEGSRTTSGTGTVGEPAPPPEPPGGPPSPGAGPADGRGRAAGADAAGAHAAGAGDTGTNRRSDPSGLPGDRRPADDRRSPWRAGIRAPGPSPLSAGLAAGAVVAIPSGIVVVLAAMVGGSAVAALAITAPPVAGIAVAASAALRGRGDRAG